MLYKYLILIIVRELILSGKIVLRANNVPFTSSNFQGPWIYGQSGLYALLTGPAVIYCSLENALHIVSNLFGADFTKYTLYELTKRNKLHTYEFTAYQHALIVWGYLINETIPKHSFLYKCHSFGQQYLDPKKRALAILDQLWLDNI